MFVHVNTVVHITADAHVFARPGFRFLCVCGVLTTGRLLKSSLKRFVVETCCKVTSSVVACWAKLPHVQRLQLNFQPLPRLHSCLWGGGVELRNWCGLIAYE